jgi:hypothetical protein
MAEIAIDEKGAAGGKVRRSTEVWVRIFNSRGSKTYVVLGCAVVVLTLGTVDMFFERNVQPGFCGVGRF